MSTPTSSTPESASSPQPEKRTAKGHNALDRLYTGESGFNITGRRKIWYVIAIVLLVVSLGSMIFRGFDLNIDFEGGTKLSMPAGDLVAEQVEDTFVDATGVEPELTQIVGSGDSQTLEIQSERLSQDQIDSARAEIYEEHEPLNAQGEPTPDAVGDTTVSESWGSTITERMVLALVVFLIIAALYVGIRLQREMAFAAMAGLVFDGILIAGIYSVLGLEVSPAVVIGLLTVLTFSIYDTVIVFDKVKENTTGILESRRSTYDEQANLAVNQTVMRSISTSVIAALPIIALLVVAVWLMGVGTLRDLALIQLIGVLEGIFSSLFLATPLLVSIVNKRKDVKAHNKEVAAYRAGEIDADEPLKEAGDDVTGTSGEGGRTVATPAAPTSPVADTEQPGGGATWRPNRS